MKTVLFALCLTSLNAFAGIPRTTCSTYNSGIQILSDMPGTEFVKVFLDSKGRFEKLSTLDLNILESNIHIIRETNGTNGSYSKVYSATLNISKLDGNQMPDAYTAIRRADGSLEVDVICRHSVF